MTQETTPAQQEVQAGMTDEQAASELLKRWGGTEQTPPEEDQPEEAEQTEADQVKPEAEDDAEEVTEESEEIEIDVAGEKIKVPAAAAEVARKVEAKVKEIEAGATRKFQEAADHRKFADAQIERASAIAQLSQQEVDLLADQRTIDRRLQQLLSIDTSALYESDPASLARLTAEAQQLQFAKQRVDGALQQARDQSKAEKGKAESARLTHLQDWAKKNIPTWTDDYSQTLLEFSVKELGADPQALRNVMSEPVLKALHLAYKGWKVQNTDPKAKQVPSGTKTLKPGAAGNTKSNAQATADTAMRRLAQTNSTDDAVAALLARSNVKKRR